MVSPYNTSTASLPRLNFLRDGISRNRVFAAAVAMVLFFAAAPAYSQLGAVSRYTMTTFNGTFVDATSGNYLGASDDSWYNFSSPFAIVYDSTTVPAGTNMYCTDDGNFGIGTLSGNDYYTNWLGSSTHAGALCGFNVDLIHIYGGNYWTVVGTAPNRAIVIEQYRNSPYYNGSYVTSFEVKIYETSGVIEMLYADHGYYFGATGHIGINGLKNVPNNYNAYSYNGTSSMPSTDIRWTPPLNAPPAQLSLNPKTLGFGFTTPQLPVTMYATASNVGSATLHIKGITMGGSADFTKTSGPNAGDSILPGNSAQFGITFTPTASGSRTGSFILSTDGRDSGVQSVTLNGNGVLPAVQYGATDLFRKVHTRLGTNSAPQYIPVQSTGLAGLTFTSVYFIGLDSLSYSISHLPPNPLPAGVTDSIGVVFNPHIEGRPDAKLVIVTNAQNTPYDTVRMLGIGVLPRLVIMAPPDSNNYLAFDSVAMGDSVCRTVVLSNPGSDTLHLRRQLMTSADYDFTMYPLTGTDTLILPGASKLMNVCFRPLKNGNRLATIGIYTDIPKTFTVPQADTSQFTIHVTGIGVPYGMLSFQGSVIDTSIDKKQNCMTEHIMNVGQADMTLTSASIVGTNSTAWTWSGVTLPVTLPAGQSINVQLCYTASASGSQFDTLKLAGTSAGRPLTQSLVLQGVGLNSCISSTPVAPGPVSFGMTGKTLVGMTDTATITVTNCGDIAGNYTAQLSAGSTGYTLIGTGAANVAAGNSTTYQVAFNPTTIGAANGTLNVTGGPTPIALTLSGVGGGVVASATSSVATADSGDCVNFDVTITNTGNVDWNPGMPTFSDAEFSWVSGPGTVPAGGSGMMTVRYCPKHTGTATSSFTFPNAAPAAMGGFTGTVSGTAAGSGISFVTRQNGFVLGQSYPNPMNGSADVMITLPQTSEVRIDLIDEHGTLVHTAYQGRLAQGDQLVTLDAKGLSSGTYLYVLTAGDVRLSRQLTIVK